MDLNKRQLQRLRREASTLSAMKKELQLALLQYPDLPFAQEISQSWIRIKRYLTHAVRYGREIEKLRQELLLAVYAAIAVVGVLVPAVPVLQRSFLGNFGILVDALFVLLFLCILGLLLRLKQRLSRLSSGPLYSAVLTLALLRNPHLTHAAHRRSPIKELQEVANGLEQQLMFAGRDATDMKPWIRGQGYQISQNVLRLRTWILTPGPQTERDLHRELFRILYALLSGNLDILLIDRFPPLEKRKMVERFLRGAYEILLGALPLGIAVWMHARNVLPASLDASVLAVAAVVAVSNLYRVLSPSVLTTVMSPKDVLGSLKLDTKDK